MQNVLNGSVKRQVVTCNFNQHDHAPHPDRVLEFHDLIYVKEGTWQIGQDDQVYDLVAGDVILLQKGHRHYGVKDNPDLVKTIFVHFKEETGDGIKEEASKGDFSFPMVVHGKSNPMIEHYFQRMIYSYWSEDENAAKKASAYLELCLCEISGMGQSVGEYSSLVEKVKLQIKQTPGRFLQNQELAELNGCSVRTLTEKFKKSMGQSLHGWQMKIKCQMADELMKSDPSLTLKEIAVLYGFYDEYHFGKCYKKYFGYSPKKRF